MIELRRITEENFEKCISLSLKEEQSKYIASNAYSLSQAYAIQNDGINFPMPYAVYKNNEMIGFIMAEYQPIDSSDPDDDEDIYYLSRLMIDKRYQGNGYGKEAMNKMVELVKTYPFGKAEAFILCVSKENETAYALYKSIGFTDTGNIDDDGDQICRLDI